MTTVEMMRTAIISNDQRFRYRLGRRWGEREPYVCWVMLNPSTADADIDDPTIRRCIAFTQEWGFDALQVVNLFAMRSTDPEALLAVPIQEWDRAVGPMNDEHVRDVAHGAAIVVCGWGSHKKLTSKRVGRVGRTFELISEKYPMCLDINSDGQPKHPLYVKGGTPLKLWRPPA